ncbi:hypothetical protein [Thermovirga sp.]|uniref:hypothetical protein n=1 Tax=Thermovirga sp. TaxID=2699834 RepID=UPI0025E63E84|nr:hypothetical protein [Thermovirga sp.]MBO8154544.1 hypothetical protein [Thermovirga sp.]
MNYFYTIGKSVRIPLSSTENQEYIKRVEKISSIVEPIILKWEDTLSPLEEPLPHADFIAHLVRALAEALPASEISQLKEKDFVKKAYASFSSQDNSKPIKESLNEALETICLGFDSLLHNAMYGAIHDLWELSVMDDNDTNARYNKENRLKELSSIARTLPEQLQKTCLHLCK